VFTARYAQSPYIKQISFAFKWLSYHHFVSYPFQFDLLGQRTNINGSFMAS